MVIIPTRLTESSTVHSSNMKAIQSVDVKMSANQLTSQRPAFARKSVERDDVLIRSYTVPIYGSNTSANRRGCRDNCQNAFGQAQALECGTKIRT